MQLPKKLEIFSIFFIEFLEFALNFGHSGKKMNLMDHEFLKLLTPKDVFSYMHKRSCFWKLFRSESVNESLRLPKSLQKYFYYTFSSVWVNFR